jgi:hypothetical protein
MNSDDIKKALEECKCGFCVNEKPRNLITGWRGWFICDECVELLAEICAQQNPGARERLITMLTAMRARPPEA